MTQQAQALSESLASAARLASLAKANREAASKALSHYVRSRMKSGKVTTPVLCHRLGWPVQKLSNFFHLHCGLDEDDITRMLNAVEVHLTRPEAKRFSRSARIMEGKYKRAVKNLND